MVEPEGDTPRDHLSPDQGSETILFVDDETYLADVGREMLEDFGYVVDSMISPVQAFESFEKNQNRYDLLITDYTMPRMRGDELVEKIHALRPSLPVIVCTGIELPLEIRQKVAIEKILLKPFGMDELLRVVREVLDSKGSGE